MANLVNFRDPISPLPSKSISQQVREDYMVKSTATLLASVLAKIKFK